jgi:hypothetical protein
LILQSDIPNTLSDIRALSLLVLKDNRLLTAEAGKVLSDMLATNTVLKVLDLSSNNWKDKWGDWVGNGPGFAKELAVGISENEALTTLDISENNLGALFEHDLPDGWVKISRDNDNRSPWIFKHSDGRSQGKHPNVKPYGIIAIANAIPDMGAILSVNLLKNNIGVELASQAEDLVSILKDHPTLKSLCGNKGNETELDMSGKMRGATDAMMLVPEIIDNRALTMLDISKNRLGGFNTGYNRDGSGYGMFTATPEGPKVIADAIKDMGALSKLIFGGDGYYRGGWVIPEPATLELGMTEADLSNKGLDAAGAMIVAAWISHRDKGALIKLDISNNYIGAEQKGGLQCICMASGIKLAE